MAVAVIVMLTMLLLLVMVVLVGGYVIGVGVKSEPCMSINPVAQLARPDGRGG